MVSAEGERLAGRRIVVTRARDQAAELARALEAAGAAVIVAPVIRIAALPDLGALRAALTGIRAYRWVVFTSQNAVQIVFDRLAVWGQSPRVFDGIAVAAVGTVTADALARHGVAAALVPHAFVAEALVEAIAARERGDLAGARVLIPSAQDARAALADGLRAHGASVDNIPIYRTVPAETDLRGLAADLKAGRIDAVTFTSSSTVRCFVDLVGRDAATAEGYLAAAIGPVTARTARELGLRDVIAAEPHTAAGLVAALARRLA